MVPLSCWTGILASGGKGALCVEKFDGRVCELALQGRAADGQPTARKRLVVSGHQGPSESQVRVRYVCLGRLFRADGCHLTLDK